MHPDDYGLIPCVSVSTTEDSSPSLETEPDLKMIGQAFNAIRQLKKLGWVVGCDSELIPPLWALREFSGDQ